MVSTLRRYVEQESPSGSAAAIASLVALIAADFAAIGGRVRLHKLGVRKSGCELRASMGLRCRSISLGREARRACFC